MPNQTGPTTTGGKLVVSRNAVSHGLRAADIVLRSETKEDWEGFHDSVLEDMRPHGPLETALAARVAELFWRLRRASRAERQIISRIQAAADAKQLAGQRVHAAQERGMVAKGLYDVPMVPASEVTFIPTTPKLIADDRGMDQIIRFEAHINRQLMQTLHELEALQERRKGNRTPLARVDVHGAPKQ